MTKALHGNNFSTDASYRQKYAVETIKNNHKNNPESCQFFTNFSATHKEN